MGDYFKRVFAQVREFIGQLSPQKKIAMSALRPSVIGGIIAAFIWAGNTTFAPLMTNLSPKTPTRSSAFSGIRHIPFRVDPSGKNITVPLRASISFA